MALLSLSACATKGDLRNIQTEIRGLSARQDSVLLALRLQSQLTQDSLRGTADQLFQIRGSVTQQLDRILNELSEIRELSGQNQRTIASIRDQLEGLRRASLMAAQAPVEPGGGQPAPRASGTAEETYNAALVQFNRGSLTAARIAFQQFLRAYPSHELAPEAEYKLADILVQEGSLEAAIDAFARIPELYPDALKVSDALYRIGVLHVELGQEDEARTFFERVVNTYPNSAIADLAQGELTEMGNR